MLWLYTWLKGDSCEPHHCGYVCLSVCYDVCPFRVFDKLLRVHCEWYHVTILPYVDNDTGLTSRHYTCSYTQTHNATDLCGHT